mgnify:FL=1
MGLDEEYQKLVEEILSCRKCDLWKTRTNAVVGEGPLNAEIMFIGEAPGYNEDIQGRPFVGAAGKLLTELITKIIGIERSSVYITNVVKCRPPENRDPKEDEINACTPYLLRQLEIIKPKIIVTLGRHSTKFIFKLMSKPFYSISRVRGKVFVGRILSFDTRVIPTYHPAAALYNPRLRSEIEKDFHLIALEYKNLSKKVKIGLEKFFE